MSRLVANPLKWTGAPLPAGITGVGSFNQVTSIYTPPGATDALNALGAITAKSAQGTGGLERWAWIGASEVRFTPPSSNVVATTSPPRQLTLALQRMGLPVADGAASLMDMSYQDLRWSAPTGWSIAKTGNGIGMANNATNNTCTYTPLSPKRFYEIWYFDTGSSNLFSYSIDGATAVNVVGTSTNAPKKLTIDATTAAVHTITLKALAAVSTTIFYHANAYNSNDLSIDNFGSSGSGAGTAGAGIPIWGSTTNNYDILSMVIATAPAVAMVSLGANDYFNGSSVSTYQTALDFIINTLQTAGIQVVLFGIYPFVNPATSPTDFPLAWRQVAYTLADKYGCPLIDMHDRWVNATRATARGLVGNDTEVGAGYYIHPTPSGHSDICNSMMDLLGPMQTLNPLNNFTALTDPTVNDDSTRGYAIGSSWTNTASGGLFVASSVTTGAAVWIRQANASSVAAVVPQPGASNILLPFTNSASAANVGGAQNQGLWTPLLITRPTPITGLAFHVTTAAAGGAAVVARCAIFNDNGAGGVGTLIADYGTTAVTSTGLKTVAGARTLQPGVYWTAFKYEYTTVPTTAPQFTSMSSVQPLPGPAMNSINYRCLALSGISGAFTSNPAAIPSTVNAPIVGLVVT